MTAGTPSPPGLRRRLRFRAMGLGTVLGFARRGYFIPYRYAAEVPDVPPRGAYPEIEALFDARRDVFAGMLRRIDGLAAALEAIGADDPPQPRWNQGWFPRLDAAAAYGMIRSRAPRRVIEVGSGHSTRFMVRAGRDGGVDAAFTCVDPQPRADLAGLGVRHIAGTAQSVGIDPFRDLAAGDVLFVDSSHILMPGSDVDFVINRVWPMLPAGVMVHVHDVFLPDGYPESWRWRGYNEQLAVAPLLTGGGADVLFASHFVAGRMADQMAGTVLSRLPMMAGAMESSLWLEKRGL